MQNSLLLSWELVTWQILFDRYSLGRSKLGFQRLEIQLDYYRHRVRPFWQDPSHQSWRLGMLETHYGRPQDPEILFMLSSYQAIWITKNLLFAGFRSRCTI